MEDKQSKPRSPHFPFISLARAVARAQEFEASHKHHTVRFGNALGVWGYKEKTSGGIQTVAALSAFGLLEDEGEGSGNNRKVKLTPLALAILKDGRSGTKEAALRRAALSPRAIAEMWSSWGAHRPPDNEAVRQLHIDRHFTESAAARFLRVYDATIRYAGLAEPDNTGYSFRNYEELYTPGEAEIRENSMTSSQRSAGPLLYVAAKASASTPDERVVFAHELRPNQRVRVVVAGDLDIAMARALRAFAEFQLALLAETVPSSNAPPNADAGPVGVNR